ncbi:MAG: sulfotransferase [Halioglobus sp.]|nr:sulfotransferase [Halioglobus sp.]
MSARKLNVPQYTRARVTRASWLTAINAVGAPLRGMLRPDAGKWLARALAKEARKSAADSASPDAVIVEALEQLTSSLCQDARLNVVGCLTARDETVRLLQKHLQLRERMQMVPSLLATELPPTVFIVGLPRTGSTFLHHLLAADPTNRTMPYWESYEPLPPLSGSDQRLERVTRMLAQLERMAPSYQAIHPMQADLPEECVALFMNVLRSLQFDIQYRIPRYARWLLSQDATIAYRAYREQLQVVQHYRPSGDRLLLKDPTHACHLSALLDVFPDAKIIFMHRHPVDTFSSICSLYAYTRAIFSDDVPADEIGEEIMEGYWPIALAHMQAVRADLPTSRYIDVCQQDLAIAPIETLARIYSHFGMNFDNNVRRAMRTFLEGKSAVFRGNHTHSLAGFGLSENDCLERFTPYVDEFGLSRRRA